MKLFKTLTATAVAAVMSSGAMAADIALIIGSNQDSFWNVVKKGAEQAAMVVEANGGSLNILQTQNYDNYGADLATLIEQAVAQGVDGIATVLPAPDAQMPAIHAAIEAGIKVTLLNGGGDFLAESGALNYFGSDEYVAGVAGGKYMAEKGAKHIMCHIQIPGTVNLEARCKGVSDGATEAGAKATILRVPANLDGDVAGTSAAIEAELNGDPSIDAVINLATWAADASSAAIEQLGKTDTVMLGTFDLSPSTLDRIKAGTQAMAIDQTPYYQGFLSVSTLAAHIDFGTKVATAPVLTGPAIVDASNIDATFAGVKAGTR
ncbi:D-ribose-binding periplasmic protein precursor [Pelagimonas phthalicica]|uniref:D-ribose-binding periplasmic protein n=1 Tax=Pelagimonas phthalicica TaxID=1037362 RepID=A0A238J7S7_9RHOB|nr:substrate-binding domain-containing protein [Pelagimonas phthalicica]TDS95541.1 monosaccharide ABC transporter substrate-binding protein (CUT2 family) [Pelagimonas phthalicica]SMX25936.1 D-ribose-binding periplasmic protein precursor [Pelagimonas phthalicica]